MEATVASLAGAIVRLRTRDEYDGMLGKVCGLVDEGETVLVKHRPITFPHRRETIVHCFRLTELEVVKS